MKTILETTQLEFDKSDFLIDLVEHDNGQLYVEIVQTILYSNQKAESIKINPSVLTDIIKVLQNYHAKLPEESKLGIKHITETDQKKIQERYLKGVSIKDLAMQFDQSFELIKMVLRNKGVEIVENRLSKSMFWRKKNKWKKGKR
jgi:hypothetical protein